MSTLLTEIRANHKLAKKHLETFMVSLPPEGRRTADQRTELRSKLEEVMAFEQRIIELSEQEERESAAAGFRREVGLSEATITTRGRAVYGPSEPHSYFADLNNARRGDHRAAERLAINNDVAEAEHRSYREFRAGDMASSSASTGGTFAPPAWLISDWVELARPYRVTANLVDNKELPGGVSTINLPKVASGASTAIVAAQNSTVSDTAMTTTSVSSGISTISGKQIVSLELINQSGIPFDQVILSDLARDYAQQLNNQVLKGTGTSGELRGIRHAAGAGTTTFTTTQPSFISTTAANSFYNKVISAIATVNRTRYAAPEYVLMHSDRFAWILEALDGQQRPLVTPNGAIYNAPAVSGEPTSAGVAGTLAGLPVVTDPQILQNLGVATNQDEIYVLRPSTDMTLWETPLRLESFDAPYADQNSVLYRALGWAAFIPDRYGASTNIISGTGLVVPAL